MEIINITFTTGQTGLWLHPHTHTVSSRSKPFSLCQLRLAFKNWSLWLSTLVCRHPRSVSCHFSSKRVHSSLPVSPVRCSIACRIRQQWTNWSKPFYRISSIFLSRATEIRVQPSPWVSRFYHLAAGESRSGCKVLWLQRLEPRRLQSWSRGQVCDKITRVWASSVDSTCRVWSDNGGRSSSGKFFPPPDLPEGSCSTEERRSGMWIQPFLAHFTWGIIPLCLNGTLEDAVCMISPGTSID